MLTGLFLPLFPLTMVGWQFGQIFASDAPVFFSLCVGLMLDTFLFGMLDTRNSSASSRYSTLSISLEFFLINLLFFLHLL